MSDKFYMRKYRVRNKEKVREAQRKWSSRNKEKINELSLKNYYKHRQKRLENMKAYAAANAEAIRERNIRNRPRKSAQRKAWALANPDRCRLVEAKRKAKIKAGTATQAEIHAIRQRQGDQCHYCWGPLGNNGRGHIEHMIPLIRDGLHAASNIVISCPACNRRKGRQTDSEFIEKSVSHKTIAKKFSILMQCNPDPEEIVRELGFFRDIVCELEEALSKRVI